MGALDKIFINRFYVQNTGFFLVLFYLLFGTVQGGSLLSFHHGLIEGFLTSPSFLVLVMVLWGIYGLKCVAYVMKTLALPHFSFLFSTWGCMPVAKQRQTALWIQLSIYAPVLAYSGVASVIGVREGHIVPVIFIALFNVAMCMWPVFLYSHKLINANLEATVPVWLRWLNRRMRKPSWLYYPFELLTRYPRLVWSTKAISFGVLMITFYFMKDASFDPRALMLGVLCMVLLHAIVIFRYRYFEDLYLTFMRNLPIPTSKRYGQLWLTYIVLLLPEFILLGVHTMRVGAFTDMWIVVLYSISLCLLLHSLLLFPRLDPESYSRWVFGIFFVVLFMILGYQYVLSLVLLQVAIVIIFWRQFPRYEAIMEEEIRN